MSPLRTVLVSRAKEMTMAWPPGVRDSKSSFKAGELKGVGGSILLVGDLECLRSRGVGIE